MWDNAVIIYVIILYVITSSTSITIEEVFALWSMSSTTSGGLNAKPNFIGTVQAITGLSPLLMQLVIGPSIISKLGYIRSVRHGMIISAVCLMAIPLTAHMHADFTVLGVVLTCLAIVRAMGFYLCVASPRKG